MEAQTLTLKKSLTLLEDAGDYRYYHFADLEAVPLAEMEAMVKEAWAHDYRDRAILKFDEEYLRWLMPKDQFFGVWVTNRQGRGIGCEIGLDRRLKVHGRHLQASYVTLLTVVPRHRGKGVAQKILSHLTRLAVEVRRADVLISVFDDNAAGMPTVDKFLGANSIYDWSIVKSSPFLVWAASPDLREVDRYEPLKGAARIALAPGIRQMLEFRPGSETREVTWQSGEIDSNLGGAVVSFTQEQSLIPMYAGSRFGSAGVARANEGTVSYHVPEVMCPKLPDRKMCQIQRVDGPDPLGTLRAFNGEAFKRGSICTFLANTQGLPATLLLRAGFLPTDRRVRVAIRGPKALVETLGDLSGKWLVDVL